MGRHPERHGRVDTPGLATSSRLRRVPRKPKVVRDAGNALVARPQLCAARQRSACQQMRIDPANTTAGQRMALHEHQCFAVRGHGRRRQHLHRAKNPCALAQVSTGKFTDHERVAQHESNLQYVREQRITAPKMIDPDRGVDEDHFAARRWRENALRRRRGARAWASLPPRRASLRAASRSTKASNASCSTTERSLVPAAAVAALSKSSSIVTVVRMSLAPIWCWYEFTPNCASFDALFYARKFLKSTGSLHP